MSALSVFFLFAAVNTIKVAAFNLYVADEKKPFKIIYKIFYTFIFTILIYLILSASTSFLLVLFYILQAVYIMVCISYFNFYHYFLHIIQGFKLLKESIDVVIHKSVPRNANQLIAVIDLPMFIYLYANHNQLLKAMHYEDSIIFSCLLLILAIEFINFLKEKSLIQLIRIYPDSESLVVENYGTLINMLIDFCMFHKNDKIAEQFDYGEPKTIKSESLKRPNIIIIQLESVDSNAVNLTYEGSCVMPFLYSLTEKSIYYPYMMNYHKAGGTSDAEFSIMNSVEPLSNFPSIKLPSYEHVNSFVRVLSRNSYNTAVFHGNHADYYKRDHAFSSMGFDKFYDMKEMNLKDAGWGAPDHEVLNFVLGKMQNQANPFFYYIITMSNHCRFTNALRYHHNTSFDDIGNKNKRNFYNSLSYVDASLQSFVQKVQALDKETYVIILGDHTPGLKKKIYKQASIKIENRYTEFVPLFIILPEGTVYKEKEKVASFLDIAPTVLELANIHGEYSTYGESLIAPFHTEGKEIPYRGYFFDRKQLYDEIEKLEQQPYYENQFLSAKKFFH